MDLKFLSLSPHSLNGNFKSKTTLESIFLPVLRSEVRSADCCEIKRTSESGHQSVPLAPEKWPEKRLLADCVVGALLALRLLGGLFRSWICWCRRHRAGRRIVGRRARERFAFDADVSLIRALLGRS